MKVYTSPSLVVNAVPNVVRRTHCLDVGFLFFSSPLVEG